MFFPPEITVPLTEADYSREDEWKAADSRGSADSAYALGVLLAHRGEREGAEAAWVRADRRGSAEGAYSNGVQLFRRGSKEEAEEAWNRAADRGSFLAALSLATLAEHRGNSVDARASWDRTRDRAEIADERGSADAAFVLAQVLVHEGNLAGAQAAAERADSRGSHAGASLNAGLLYGGGDVLGAEAALSRALFRGMASAGYQLGVLLQHRRRYARARRVWRQTGRLAIAQGDTETFEAVQSALRPSLGEWIRTHATLMAFIGGSLLVIGLAWNWRGAAAAFVALAAFAVWRRPTEVGASRQVAFDTGPSGGASELSVGGLTVFGGLGTWPTRDEEVPTVVRTFTQRDRRYQRLLPVLLAAIAAAMAAWSAGAYDSDVMLRCFFAWIAIVLWWTTAWVAPDAMALREAPTPDRYSAAGSSIRFGIAFELFSFVGIHLRMAIQDPVLIAVGDLVRSRRAVDSKITARLRRIARLVPLTSAALIGAFFAALAIAPERRPLAAAVWAGTSIAIGTVVLASLAGFSLYRAARAIVKRDGGELLATGVYLLATVVVIALAYVLGLLEDWLSFLRTVVGGSKLAGLLASGTAIRTWHSKAHGTATASAAASPVLMTVAPGSPP